MTLRKRVSKNVYDLDTVRMQPHPPLQIDNTAMCKHYLATYALFRVSLSLDLPRSLRLPFVPSSASPLPVFLHSFLLDHTGFAAGTVS